MLELKTINSRADRREDGDPVRSHATATRGPGPAGLTLVGITYRDLDAALDAVRDGKRSGGVAVGFGGFALNAGRAVVQVPTSAARLAHVAGPTRKR